MLLKPRPTLRQRIEQRADLAPVKTKPAQPALLIVALALIPILTPVRTLALILFLLLIVFPHDGITRLVTVFLLLKLMLLLHLPGITIP